MASSGDITEPQGRVLRARVEVLLAALLFSTGGAAIKACSLSGWQVAAGRSAWAALTLALLLPAARRAISRRVALVALAYAATLILYVLANKLTTAANAIFLQSTAPFYLLLVAPRLLGEPVRRRELVFMAAIVAGLLLLLLAAEPPRRTASHPALGNVLAAASGATWALTVAGLRWLARGTSVRAAAPAAALLGNVYVFVICAPLAWPVPSVSAADLGWLAYLGIFQIGLAYVFMTGGLRHVPAIEGALLLLLEPVLNVLWAWSLLGEVPAPLALVGASAILAATAVYTLTGRLGRRARSGPRGSG